MGSWLIPAIAFQMMRAELTTLRSAQDFIVRPPQESVLIQTRKQNWQAVVATSWAVFFAGEMRSFSTDVVHEKIKTNLFMPLEVVGGADAFFVVDARANNKTSLLRWRAAFEGIRVLGFRVVASAGTMKSRIVKLRHAYKMMLQVERVAKRKYSYVITTRPDVEHLQPICALGLLKRNVTVHTYEMIGQCPRWNVTEADPCAVGFDHKGGIHSGGKQEFWHVRMARMDAVLEALEWWLWSPRDEAAAIWRVLNKAMRAWPTKVVDASQLSKRFASVALDVAARGCVRYDMYLSNVIRSHVPISTEWEVSPEGGFSVLPWLTDVERLQSAASSIRGTGTFRLYEIALGRKDEISSFELRSALMDLYYTFANSMGDNYTSKSRQERRTPDFMVCPLVDDICVGTRIFCYREDLPAKDYEFHDIALFSRELCRRSWSARRWGKYLLHHAPSETGHFVDEVFESVEIDPA